VIVKLMVQVKLLPTPLQAEALEATLPACNEAAAWVSGIAFQEGVYRNFALRKLTCEQVKERWGLGAQAAQHVTKKTCDACTTAYTSRTCAECGHIDKSNRVSQAFFACRSCGFVDHADRNGSRNIRAKGRESWRRGAQSTAPAAPRPRDAAGRKRGITASDATLCKPGTSVPGS
jgi:hypothetical protein